MSNPNLLDLDMTITNDSNSETLMSQGSKGSTSSLHSATETTATSTTPSPTTTSTTANLGDETSSLSSSNVIDTTSSSSVLPSTPSTPLTPSTPVPPTASAPSTTTTPTNTTIKPIPYSLKLEECLTESPQLLLAFQAFGKESDVIRDFSSMVLGDCGRLHKHLDLSSKAISTLAQQLGQFQKLSAEQLYYSPVIPIKSTESTNLVTTATATATPTPTTVGNENGSTATTTTTTTTTTTATPTTPSPSTTDSNPLNSTAKPPSTAPYFGRDESFERAMAKFSQTLYEAHSWQELHSSQLDSVVIQPLQRFHQIDLKDVRVARNKLEEATAEHEAACQKYARVSKKKETERVRFEANAELYAARKKYHIACIDYYTRMKEFQHYRKLALLEPLLAYMHAQMSFFQMGFNYFQQQVKPFLTELNIELQSFREGAAADFEALDLHKEQVIQDYASLYATNLDPDDPFAEYSPPDTTLKSKNGYLFLRTGKIGKSGRKWDRFYFFTENNQLYYFDENKEQRLATTLENAVTSLYELDDRRYCFSIVTPSNAKRPLILQAESDREREEWISLINNIAAELKPLGSEDNIMQYQYSIEDDTNSPILSNQNSSNDLFKAQLSSTNSVEKDLPGLDSEEGSTASTTLTTSSSSPMTFMSAAARLKSLDQLFGGGSSRNSLTTSNSTSSIGSVSSATSPSPSASTSALKNPFKSIFRLSDTSEVNPFNETGSGAGSGATELNNNNNTNTNTSAATSATANTTAATSTGNSSKPATPTDASSLSNSSSSGALPFFEPAPTPTNQVAIPDDKGGIVYIPEKQQFNVAYWGYLEMVPTDAPETVQGPRTIGDVAKTLVPKFGLLSQKKSRPVILSLGIDYFQFIDSMVASKFEVKRVAHVGVDASNKKLFVMTVYVEDTGSRGATKTNCYIFEASSLPVAFHLSVIAGNYFRAAYKRAIETGQLIASPQSQSQLTALENVIFSDGGASTSTAGTSGENSSPPPVPRSSKPNIRLLPQQQQPQQQPQPQQNTQQPPNKPPQRSSVISTLLSSTSLNINSNKAKNEQASNQSTATAIAPTTTVTPAEETEEEEEEEEEVSLIDRRQTRAADKIGEPLVPQLQPSSSPIASTSIPTTTTTSSSSYLEPESEKFSLDDLSDDESAQEIS